MRRAIVGLAVAVLLVAGAAVGCSGDGNSRTDEAQEYSVAPTELCGGRAVSARAGKALKVITGSSKFEDDKSTIGNAVQDLGDRFTSSVTGDGDVCRVYPVAGSSHDELRVTWELSGSAPVGGDPGARFTVLKMGERALTSTKGAYLRFVCQSDELPGFAPARIEIGVEDWGKPTEPEGDVKALKDAYATVAHSFSLAMAREMACDDDGGLEAQPSLDPA